MATHEKVREWSEDARRYAFCAVCAYLCGRGTPPGLARQRAEEAAQEGVNRGLKGSPGQFKGRIHFCRFVARAAINWAISEYGRKAAMVPLGEIDPTYAGGERDEEDERLELLRAAMGNLSEADCELLRLKYVEGMTLEEIAKKQGRTVNQVWYQLNQLRERLRRIIERAEEKGM